MNTTSSNSPITTVTTVVIGAGQAGLATSYHLEQRGIDHVLLERGEIANSWCHDRWDSLKLLTPRWQTRLPGCSYAGSEPEGFMDMPELTAFLRSYAQQTNAPVLSETTVLGVYPADNGYRVVSNRGEWQCQSLVLATGAFNTPHIPHCGTAIPEQISQLSSMDYRSPAGLRKGGVLIVGASATGLQLATEIQRSGRKVTIAVGEHVRMPRRYRGQDILWWMDRCGLLDKSIDEADDINRARRLPSAQLVGSADNADLDLNSLSAGGAQLVGRLMGVNSGVAQFSGALGNVCKLADLKMNRLLNSIDEWIDCHEHRGRFPAPERFAPTGNIDSPQLGMDFQREGIDTVIWATGYRPDYSWLHVPVLTAKGQLKHNGGILEAPGLYAMGLPFMRKHKSSFIYGVSDDARDIVEHLAQYIGQPPFVSSNFRPASCICVATP